MRMLQREYALRALHSFLSRLPKKEVHPLGMRTQNAAFFAPGRDFFVGRAHARGETAALTEIKSG